MDLPADLSERILNASRNGTSTWSFSFSPHIDVCSWITSLIGSVYGGLLLRAVSKGSSEFASWSVTTVAWLVIGQQFVFDLSVIGRIISRDSTWPNLLCDFSFFLILFFVLFFPSSHLVYISERNFRLGDVDSKVVSLSLPLSALIAALLSITLLSLGIERALKPFALFLFVISLSSLIFLFLLVWVCQIVSSLCGSSRREEKSGLRVVWMSLVVSAYAFLLPLPLVVSCLLLVLGDLPSSPSLVHALLLGSTLSIDDYRSTTKTTLLFFPVLLPLHLLFPSVLDRQRRLWRSIRLASAAWEVESNDVFEQLPPSSTRRRSVDPLSVQLSHPGHSWNPYLPSLSRARREASPSPRPSLIPG